MSTKLKIEAAFELGMSSEELGVKKFLIYHSKFLIDKSCPLLFSYRKYRAFYRGASFEDFLNDVLHNEELEGRSEEYEKA